MKSVAVCGCFFGLTLSFAPAAWANQEEDAGDKNDRVVVSTAESAVTAATAYLGVRVGPIPRPLAANLGVDGGALLSDVDAGSPAAQAGLRQFDVVVAIGDARIASPEDVVRIVRQAKEGDKLTLQIIRGGKKIKSEVTLGSLADRGKPVPPVPPKDAEKPAEPGFLGVGMSPVPELLAFHLNLKTKQGIVVNDVIEGTAADAARIKKHFVILSVDGKPVEGVASFTRLLADRKLGEKVKLEVIDRGANRVVEVELGRRPAKLPRPVPDWTPFDPRIEDWPRRWKFKPGEWKQRMKIIGPDGKEWSFDFPQDGKEHADRWGEIQKRLQELGALQSDDDSFSKQLEEILKKAHKPGELKGHQQHQSSSKTVIRSRDNEYDIKIVTENGTTKVTVKRGDEVIAEDLPAEKLKELPQEVQDRVEALRRGSRGHRELRYEFKKSEDDERLKV